MAKNHTNSNGNGNGVAGVPVAAPVAAPHAAVTTLSKETKDALMATLNAAMKDQETIEAKLVAAKARKSAAVEAIAKAIAPLTSFKLTGSKVTIGSRDGVYFLKGQAAETDLPDFGA